MGGDGVGTDSVCVLGTEWGRTPWALCWGRSGLPYNPLVPRP